MLPSADATQPTTLPLPSRPIVAVTLMPAIFFGPNSFSQPIWNEAPVVAGPTTPVPAAPTGTSRFWNTNPLAVTSKMAKYKSPSSGVSLSSFCLRNVARTRPSASIVNLAP